MTEPIDGLYCEGEKIADTKAPHSVPTDRRWEQHKFKAKLASPANRRELDIIVVDSGLADGVVAASLNEQGCNVKVLFCQDSARRVHSITAQGGIDAAKNHRNDGDPVYRLFYDAVKGGDHHAREDNAYRLMEVSVNIIDQCVAQGVPFVREYGGPLDNRSLGGMQVSRTFYTRGQISQQLFIGAYQVFERQVYADTVKEFRCHEMVELVIVRGRAHGIVTRDMISGEIETHLVDTAVLASGGYDDVFLLSTNVMGCNVTAVWRVHREGAYFANPYYMQVHSTCVPQSGGFRSKLTLMSESLRNDGRIWVSKKTEDRDEGPCDIPEEARDYHLERIYPTFGNLTSRDITSRRAKNICDEGRGVDPTIKERDTNGNKRVTRHNVCLDFSEAINRLDKDAVLVRCGDLLEMYQCTTGDDPYKVPTRIYPAVHYTMGDLWADYDLEPSVPDLYIVGGANFSGYGASRLSASAPVQGLTDGYPVLPNAINDYLADMLCLGKVDPNTPEIAEAKHSVEKCVARLMILRGTRSADDFHMALGCTMWEYCDMERCDTGLHDATGQTRALREKLWRSARTAEQADELSQALEKAGRLLNFLELAELVCIDALYRWKPCGGHFRAEPQTPEGEALRHDDKFLYVAVWEWDGENQPPALHKEDLVYKGIELRQWDYK